MGMDMDSRVVIPYTTASRRVFNTPYIKPYLACSAGSEPGRKKLRTDTAGSPSQGTAPHTTGIPLRIICVRGAYSVSKMAKGLIGTLNLFLGLVSLISLIVGGIVVMNIMLISVGERVKEIGLPAGRSVRGKRDIQKPVPNRVVAHHGDWRPDRRAGGARGGSTLTDTEQRVKCLPLLSWEPFILGFIFSAIDGCACWHSPG